MHGVDGHKNRQSLVGLGAGHVQIPKLGADPAGGRGRGGAIPTSPKST
jgi:hypothetical protein